MAMLLNLESKYIEILKNKGVGVLPTDTLYGIVGSALSKEVVSRIYAIKGRDEEKPFIILLSSPKDLKLFGVTDQRLITHAQSYWSTRRSTSVILPVADRRFTYLHRGTKSLAFRVPRSKKLQTLLAKTGPLVAPSANPQGLPPATCVTEARQYFGNSLDFYMSGPKKEGKASRIISLLNKEPTVIRP